MTQIPNVTENGGCLLFVIGHDSTVPISFRLLVGVLRVLDVESAGLREHTDALWVRRTIGVLGHVPVSVLVLDPAF